MRIISGWPTLIKRSILILTIVLASSTLAFSKPVGGKAGIERLGKKLPEVASIYGVKEGVLKDKFNKDKDLKVDKNNK
jgi:hypothetical protein